MDLPRTLASAEAAYRAGDLRGARARLTEMVAHAKAPAAAFHLLAMVARREQRDAEARAHFGEALARAPGDAEIHNNYANFCGQQGDVEGALRHYAVAAATPGPVRAEALVNRAVLHQQRQDPVAALADIEAALALVPARGSAHSIHGTILRDLDRLDEAAAAFDRALAFEPSRATALRGRARVALERGEPDAAGRFRHAASHGAAGPDVLLGLANALEAQGDPAGMALLENAVVQVPGWVEAHEELARMRSEAGLAHRLTESHDAALARVPTDPVLHRSRWRLLGTAGRHVEALAALDEGRAALGNGPDLLLEEAKLATEARDLTRAGYALAQLPEDGAYGLAHARHALATGQPDRAAALLERFVQADPDHVGAWAFLDLTWRLLGDPRHAWLSGQPDLFAARRLPMEAEALADLAALLRDLHRSRSHPIGQSLRGGTQTRGRLLARTEPQLRALKVQLLDAIAAHMASLPPADRKHPLLRHRDAQPGLAGSWSVRLHGAGFHVSHIHPRGVLSSALYVAVPEALDGQAREGWLELGRPPASCGVALEPLAQFEPQPGRLVLFPSYLFHGTRPFASGERLTVAFDVFF
ncbi:tetratricopeptide repeat protein [Sphingomonas sp. PL-96]|uniref:putative 2OG-Fe(II) oxygenase n=1 Tax=Sphingomonas sp. PL-96 TaxID=2887201 RepID=UPI001E32E4E9|nr:putative 2OG-Fe(II) oxygenase [Sphingomonas sp. PL-96]MCC2977362.1 tetratricopeptide repeat protein [Sphingomonas sp. PL-96]